MASSLARLSFVGARASRQLAASSSRSVFSSSGYALPRLTRGITDIPNGDREWLIVQETGASKFNNKISDGLHVVVADEPGSIPGGEDAGLNPYGLLLSSLGACTSMTVRMYADRKNIPLDKVEVRLKHDRVYGKDCEECHSKQGKVDVIDVHVELVGDKLTDEDRKALMEIANKCPVHKTLTTETLVHIKPASD